MNFKIAGRSNFAGLWLFGGTGIQALLFLLGWRVHVGLLHNGSWTNLHLAALVSLGFLLLAAALMHHGDYNPTTEEGEGFGVRYVYHSTRSQSRLDDNVVSGVLARESVQCAITLAILAAVTAKVGEPVPFKVLISDPAIFFPSLIMMTLGLSVITTLAGLLCYDYSSRFDWGHNKEIQRLVINKGHRLGVLGFYALMWSLAALPVLRSPQLCMLTVLVVFLVMWYYYFFPVDRVTKARASARA